MRRLGATAGVLIALALLAAAGTVTAPPARAATPSALTLAASPQPATSGQSVTLSGQATGAPAGSTVELEQSPYPYKTQTPAG